MLATYRRGELYRVIDSLDSEMGRVSMLVKSEEKVASETPVQPYSVILVWSMQLVTTAPEAKIAITTGADLSLS